MPTPADPHAPFEPHEHYAQLLASIDGILWEADAQTLQMTFVSPQAERLLGYPVRAWLEPGFWAAHIHPDDSAAALDLCRRATAELRVHDFEYRMIAADGRVVWLRDIVRVQGEGGVPVTLRGIMIDVTESHRVAEERQEQVRFLECLDRVNRAIQGTTDLEQMMRDVLDEALATFACDRAFLGSPCDPAASAWDVAVERLAAGAPAAPGGPPLPDAGVAEALRVLATSNGAVTFGRTAAHPVPSPLRTALGVQSLLAMCVRPSFGVPYCFSLQQCAHARAWSPAEHRLFEEIGRRLADALTSLLLYRRMHESEARLAEAQRVAHVGYWEWDLATDKIVWSDETYRIFGLDPRTDTITSNLFEQLIHPDDRSAKDRALEAAQAGGVRYDVEYRIVRPCGEQRVVHSQGDLIRDARGRAGRVFGIAQDITDRKRVEAALRTSESRFRILVDHATDAFFLHDADGVVLDANQQACDSLGYSRQELIGILPLVFDGAMTLQELAEVGVRFDTEPVVSFDTLHRRKDGTVFPVEVRVRSFWEGGRRRSVSLARDITERKRTEQALRESLDLLEAVVEGTSDAVFVKDAEGRYLLVNAAGAQLLGRPVADVLGKSDATPFPAAAAKAIAERERMVMATGVGQTFEHAVVTDGTMRTYLSTTSPYRDSAGRVIGVVGISRDITEFKRMEDQLRQAQKMEAVGRLAGGLAHDFNNLLTVIHCCAELLEQALPAVDPTRPLVHEIQNAGERAGKLTRQLLAFSRKQVLQPQTVCINTLLGDLHDLLRRLIGEHIELGFALDPALGRARVDPGQFEQAMLNLAVNARDAMPEGGRLLITTRNAELDQAYAASHPEVRPARYVVVTVRDSGHGMDAETRARIFEPFFTTKERGKGTGLGLAMVYGFVKQSGGHVEAETELGRGSTFTVYLPRDDADVTATRSSAELHDVPGGSETVLLVEDEDAVRSLAQLALSARGYRVIEARDGLDGLLAAEQHRGPIHLLVTDLVMPRLNGRRLAEQLVALRPQTRVLLVSGYTDESVLGRDAQGQAFAFLQKPFRPLDLARAVRDVLDLPRGA